VAFYFSWTNPFQEYAVINAATDMEAAGYIQAYASWELFGVNFSEVHAKALFSLYGSAGPVAVTAHASADLGDCLAMGWTWGDGTVGTSILSGVSLNTTMFPVPPATSSCSRSHLRSSTITTAAISKPISRAAISRSRVPSWCSR
jgi:hypothetical protein